MVHITAILASPESAPCNILVSLESRNGIWPLCPSVIFAITFPKVSKDLLIKAPSDRRSIFDVARSEPARSIRFFCNNCKNKISSSKAAGSSKAGAASGQEPVIISQLVIFSLGCIPHVIFCSYNYCKRT